MNADWSSIISGLRKAAGKMELPSVSKIAEKKRDPFKVLISTVISLRTKDQVTSKASERLFARASYPEKMARLSEDVIADLIYPAGFYRTKAAHIRTIAEEISSRGGSVPDDMESLLTLPGVGRKTANLTLNLGFGIDGICVDTHVHRISNRIGWISTKNPEETEFALMDILPKEYWIEINELLVAYGQNVCKPVSPKCSECGFQETCPKIGVAKHR